VKASNPAPNVQIATQLAVFLENRPGALARVCDALAKAGINIHAVSTSDTVDHSVVRLVLSDPRKALFLFEEHGTLVVENDVVLIESDNRPGMLATVAERLSAGKVNIEYLYGSTLPQNRRSLLVLRVSDARKAVQALNPPAAA
jgi:hypothetical protein